MSQVITAMFDSRAEAEQVQNELRSLGIIKDDAGTGARRGGLYDKSHASYRAGAYSSESDRGMWADAGWDDDDYRLPDEDRHAYEEGVHRGHTLLTVTVDDETAARAREVIGRSNATDIDTKSSSWKSEGWRSPAAGAVASAGTTGSADRYYSRDTSDSSERYRSYSRNDVGNGPGETSYKASGYANEVAGNVKQAVGNLTGNESLRQAGEAQERKGEDQRAEGERRGDQGNEL